MKTLAPDLRLAWRLIRAHPGFAAVVVITLGLGIGANAAALGMLRGVLLASLPYPDADRLVLLWHQSSDAPEGRGPLSPPDLLDYRDRASTLSDLAGVNSFSAALTGDGEPEQVQLGVITANFFSVLGIQPALGRDFTPADDTPLDTRDPRNVSVIILSHELWVRRFSGAPDVLGRTMLVGGTPMTIIGVLPAGFRLHLPPDAGMATNLAAWTPLRIPYAAAPRDGAYLKALGRMRPGVDRAAAQDEMSAIAADLRMRYPHHEQAGLRVAVRSLADEVSAHVRPTLLTVAAAAGFVLLIACANVANLYLARLARRQREMTIRSALGGTRGQLTGQLLVETAVLATLAGLAGLGLGWAAVRLVAWLQPDSLPRVDAIQLDGPFLLTGMALALLTLLGFGLIPSLLAARPPLAESLTARGATERRGWRRLSAALVVLQAGSALVLLTATGLMLRSAISVATADLGYEPQRVISFRAALPFTSYRSPERWIQTFTELEARLRDLPGVTAVGASDVLPSSGNAMPESYLAEPLDGVPGTARQAVYRVVTPGYFQTIRTGLRHGRLPTAGDGPEALLVVVVDEALARREWGTSSPIGRRLQVAVSRFDRGFRVEQVWGVVIGVVTTVAHGRPDLPAPGTIYLSHRQAPLWNMAFVIRSAIPPSALLPAVRRAVAEIDPRLPIYSVRTLPELVAEASAEIRAVFIAAGVFATIAVTLASVGLYGVVAVAVRQRRREIGIRLALGARPATILRRVIRQGLGLAGGGVVLGLVLAVLLMRYLGGLLVGVTPLDPLSLFASAAALAGLAALASYVAAREAARINPVETLSSE